MKNKTLNCIMVILTFVVTITNSLCMIYNSYFSKLDRLPKGEFMFSSMSNDLSKTLKVYKVDINTLGTGIRAEVVQYKNNKNTTKNIYWQLNKDTAIVSWTDDNHVQINDEIVDINGEGFDSRKKIVLPKTNL